MERTGFFKAGSVRGNTPKILAYIRARSTINQGEMIEFLRSLGYDKPAIQFNQLTSRGFFKGKKIIRTLVQAPVGSQVTATKMKELQKAAKFLYQNKKIASPDYYENSKSDRAKISQRVQKGGGVFKKLLSDPLPLKTQQKIKEVFPEADFSKSKWGVDYPDPKGQEIKRFVRLGFKETTRDHLTNKQIADIKSKFSDVPESKWNFRTKTNPKGFKYGLSPTKNESMTSKIVTFISQKPHHAKEFAFRFGKGENYLLTVFDRIRGKLGPKDNTYVPKYQNQKIVGFQDNTPKGGGKVYHHADYKGKGLKIMEHPEFARANETVKLIEKTRNVELKGSTFNKLLNSLLKSPGTTPFASALERHHADLIKDPAGLQILTRDQNRYEQRIQKAVKRQVNPISIEEADKLLKQKGIRASIQGEPVGAPIIRPEKQIADYTKYILRKIQASSVPEKEKIAVAFGCRGAAEGGRIGYALGSATMNCINAKLTNDPIQSSMKLRATEGIGKIRGAATSFLKMLGRGGVKAAPYAALAAVGAGIEPLVKQFRIDDPTTYLTDESQMKGMLLATIEGETPKVDEEILNWQYPGLAAATAAGAVPGAKTVFQERRGVGPRGPLPGGVGKTRAALGLRGVLGKALGASFSPLAVAATLPISVAAQRAGGTDYGDIATDPLNWMAPAFASTGAEMATRGVKNPLLLKALRMGMSPRTLSLVSRRFGIPGLAVSAGMWGYDKWKNRGVNDTED